MVQQRVQYLLEQSHQVFITQARLQRLRTQLVRHLALVLVIFKLMRFQHLLQQWDKLVTSQVKYQLLLVQKTH